jgi:hypothetical protein
MTAGPSDGDYIPGLDDWIIVPRWDTFQHYKDRSPLWIKVYSRLLHDPRYLGLSLASRGLLLLIWLGYSQENGELSVKNVVKLSQKRASIPQLVSLNQAGFIRFSASRPLAPNREREIEREGSKGPSRDDAERQLRVRAFDLAADWSGGTSEAFDNAIDDLERELHAQLPRSVRERLWEQALRRER